MRNKTYIIAEMSANHNQDYQQALDLVHAAKRSGADAIKVQTFTADTMTIDHSSDLFKVPESEIWRGRTLYELYEQAYMPWEWQASLKAEAEEIGLDFIATAFDKTSVDFLEQINLETYKIASPEMFDSELISYVAKTGKPMIISTDMANYTDVGDALDAALSTGNRKITLLKCTSAYPAPPEEMNLSNITDMRFDFGFPVGLSDHTIGIAVPITAVALGAIMIEKHLIISRSGPGLDKEFSLEPAEFKQMVDAIRVTEKAIGEPLYGATTKENTKAKRSLFVVEDIEYGEMFTENNIRSIRPGFGLSPKFKSAFIGRQSIKNIHRGTPLSWRHLADH
jgi:N-acetylneuraminate synthase